MAQRAIEAFDFYTSNTVHCGAITRFRTPGSDVFFFGATYHQEDLSGRWLPGSLMSTKKESRDEACAWLAKLGVADVRFIEDALFCNGLRKASRIIFLPDAQANQAPSGEVHFYDGINPAPMTFPSVHALADFCDNNYANWPEFRSSLLDGLNASKANLSALSWQTLGKLARQKGVWKIGLNKAELIKAIEAI